MMVMMGAMQMQMLARGYLVYELTNQNAAVLGLVNAATALPILVLALFGGAIADRMERKRIVQLGQAGAALLALIIAISISLGSITWYYLLVTSVVHGSLMALLMPARQAMIPQLVGKEKLGNAMALNAAGMSMSTMLAPAVGGGLYALIGPAGVYYVICGMLVGALLLTGLLPKSSNEASTSRTSVLADIMAGLSYIRRTRMVMVLLLLGLATTMLAMPFRFLMPVFVVDIYHKGPEAMGLLVSLMGLGTLVGSLFIAGLGKNRRGLLLITLTFITGAALLLVSLFPSYTLALGLMLLLGLGDAGRRALNQALVMEVSDDEYRGRVWSVFMMNFGLMPLGVLPAALIAEAYGGQVAIGILAGLMLAVSVVVLITQKQLRRFQ
jgi:MFS family permease